MKTTIEIADELLVAAKKRAAEERTSVRAIVERGLRAELKHSRPRASARKGIRWVTVEGGLPPGLDVTDREAMRAFLRRR